MKQTIYIAGKVTGEPHDTCALKFSLAKIELEEQGFEVVNPIEVVGDVNCDWHTAMRKCIAALSECDAIIFLPCWKESKGAILEHKIASDLGLKIYFFSKMN